MLVTPTVGWHALTTDLERLRAIVRPHVEELRAKEAANATLRGEEPTVSPWDGSVMEVERYLEDTLNDADSYEHVKSSQPTPRARTGSWWRSSARRTGSARRCS